MESDFLDTYGVCQKCRYKSLAEIIARLKLSTGREPEGVRPVVEF